MTPPRRCIYFFVLVLAGCMEGQKPDPLPRIVSADELRPSLYQRLGGEKAISRVIDDFVAFIVTDQRIKPNHRKHFEGEGVALLKRKLIDQIGQATGGPQKYTGKNMRDAHKGMGITNEDFDALVDVLSQALIQNKVADRDRKELLDMLEPMRKDVVE